MIDPPTFYFKIGGLAVCQAGRRIAGKIEQVHKLRKAIKKIEGNMSRMKVTPCQLMTPRQFEGEGIIIGLNSNGTM